MKMEIVSWNKLTHYSVHGTATEYYVWVIEDGHGSSSKCIRGSDGFRKYHRLKNYIKKDKRKFGK